jgi:cell shape-determining protein MreC
MKTILRAQHKRARRSAVQKTIFAVLFLGAVGLLNFFHVNPFGGIAQSVGSSVWQAKEVAQREMNDFYQLFKSKQQLVDEKHALKQQIIDDQHLSISNTALREENAELKQMLGRDIENRAILASVLSRPNTSPYDTLIIDIGAKDNVHVGDEVIALGDFIVGYVSKVFRDTSHVTFYSSPGVKTNVFIGENNIPATAEGRGANNFVVQVPRDAVVEEGDIVTLANFDTQIFAVVDTIIANSADAFKTILFSNPVNVFNTKWIQVIQSAESTI